MQLPVVFVKKKKPKTMENMLSTVVHSFTKDRDYTVCISNNFLTPEDHILFIDDFQIEETETVESTVHTESFHAKEIKTDNHETVIEEDTKKEHKECCVIKFFRKLFRCRE